MDRATFARRFTLALFLVFLAPVTAAFGASSTVVTDGLNAPRQIAVGNGRLLVSETGTGNILEIRKGPDGKAVTSTVGTLPADSPAGLVEGRHGKVFVLQSQEPEAGSSDPVSRLVRISPDGHLKTVADIGAYQKTDPDPFDQEQAPTETNPFGLASLWGHGLLATDAANNDLLRIRKHGKIETVARFPTEELASPGGPELPPAGTPIQAEAVPTSVAVGPDGAWYVAELKGFPFTPGASRIWRIEPGTKNATCDPDAKHGRCKLLADGFTSVIGIAFAGDKLLVLEIVKDGLLAAESGGENGPPPVGALLSVDRSGQKTEILPGQLIAPGGIAAADGVAYVTTGTLLPPGAGQVLRIDLNGSDDGDHGHGDGHDHGDDGHHGHHGGHKHHGHKHGHRHHSHGRHHH